MKEVHLICNAHIDPIWQWDWQEGVSATLSTFRAAVRLADEFDYVFCHNEVTVYKYVEEYAPELFEEIKSLVKRGKWRIMGGWYLQPDCNMPEGESIVRQILKGKEYFLEKFGVFPTTAINFDPFGHSRGIVQIIKKCGQDSYIFMRPYKSEMQLQSEQFIWRGLDGSEIKAARAESYNTPLGGAAAEIERRAEVQPQDTVLVLWGVGNHGGGPSEKDLADIEKLKKTAKNATYLHSCPEAFFEKITPSEAVDRSLRISMPGCYTSMGRVKRKHIKLENELYFTEVICSVAAAKGLMEYPAEKLNAVCEDLLNAEFHDILPGSSVQCGEENGLNLLSHGILEAERLKTKAYFALAGSQKDAAAGEYPVVVFNRQPYELTDNIECEFMLADQNWSDEIVSRVRITDEAGNELKYQVVKEESNLALDWRKRIIFEAKLAPLSLTRFSIFVDFEKKTERKACGDLVYSDGRKYVEIDGKTGLLKNYSIGGKTFVKDGFRLVAFDDNADPWGMQAFQQKRLGENEKPFALSEKPSGPFEGLKSVQVIEDGDVYLGIEAFFEKDNTRARIGYKIYKNNDYVDVDVTLFLSDINEIVKLKIPVCQSGKLIGQTAFGSEELFTDARENVSHRYIAIDGDECFAVFNNCVYGSHYENGALYISLARGVSYCAHPIPGRPIIPADRFVKKIDQGENDFSFRIGVCDRRELSRRALEFVQKPYALNIFPMQTREVADEKPFSVSLSDKDLVLTVIKNASDGSGVVFRILNDREAPATSSFTVNGASAELNFAAFEVKTVLYKGGTLVEIDGLMI